jgi:hypothetical protein
MIKQTLDICHSFLMYKKFPYHSVSVIHRQQDLGFHVIFTKKVRDMVSTEIKDRLKSMEFTYSFV